MRSSHHDLASNKYYAHRPTGLRDTLLDPRQKRAHTYFPGESNQCVLAVTCALFTCFMIAEAVGAVEGHSLALLGDATALSVDVFNYFSSLCAERVRSNSSSSLRVQYLAEVLVPMFSLLTMVVVTLYVVIEAILVLTDPDSDNNDHVDISVMFGFAGVNLGIDIAAGVIFYLRGRDGFVDEIPRYSQLRASVLISDSIVSVIRSNNLNMISALTAVIGDTARTLSVLIAAFVSIYRNIHANTCDAWAAIAVTISVAIISIPLIRETYKNAMDPKFYAVEKPAPQSVVNASIVSRHDEPNEVPDLEHR